MVYYCVIGIIPRSLCRRTSILAAVKRTAVKDCRTLVPKRCACMIYIVYCAAALYCEYALINNCMAGRRIGYFKAIKIKCYCCICINSNIFANISKKFDRFSIAIVYSFLHGCISRTVHLCYIPVGKCYHRNKHNYHRRCHNYTEQLFLPCLFSHFFSPPESF